MGKTHRRNIRRAAMRAGYSEEGARSLASSGERGTLDRVRGEAQRKRSADSGREVDASLSSNFVEGLGASKKKKIYNMMNKGTLSALDRNDKVRWQDLTDGQINQVFKDVLDRDVSSRELSMFRGEQAADSVKGFIHGVDNEGGELYVQREKRKEEVDRILQGYVNAGQATNLKKARNLFRDRLKQNFLNNYIRAGKTEADAEKVLRDFKKDNGKRYEFVNEYIDGAQWGAVNRWEEKISHKGDLFEKGGILGNLGFGSDIRKLVGFTTIGLPQAGALLGGAEAAEASLDVTDSIGIERQHARVVGNAIVTIVGAVFASVTGGGSIAAAAALNQLGNKALTGQGSNEELFRNFMADTVTGLALYGVGSYLQGVDKARAAAGLSKVPVTTRAGILGTTGFAAGTAGGLIREQDLGDAVTSGAVSGATGATGAFINTSSTLGNAAIKYAKDVSFQTLGGTLAGRDLEDALVGAAVGSAPGFVSSAIGSISQPTVKPAPFTEPSNLPKNAPRATIGGAFDAAGGALLTGLDPVNILSGAGAIASRATLGGAVAPAVNAVRGVTPKAPQAQRVVPLSEQLKAARGVLGTGSPVNAIEDLGEEVRRQSARVSGPPAPDREAFSALAMSVGAANALRALPTTEETDLSILDINRIMGLA